MSYVLSIAAIFLSSARSVELYLCTLQMWTFSQLKLIKTHTRNRTNEKTLDSLLIIAIKGPALGHFPIKEAVDLWASKNNRKLSL